MKCNYYILFLLLLMTSGAFAQSNFGVKKPFKVISFGQKIEFGNIDNSVNWTISNKSGGTSPVYLKGNEINNYVFEKSGSYEIRFSETKKHSEECYHPAFDETMTVEVSAVKMIFDLSKVVFSDQIQQGRDCEGITVSVPVNITFQGQPNVKFSSPDINVAGIGSEIIAKPVQKEITLKEGTQIIKYNLSGVASREAYLMFDFVDNNNQVQCYNLPQIIK